MSSVRLKKYEEQHFIDTAKPVWNYSLFDEEVLRNFKNGQLYNAYDFFGSHYLEVNGTPG
jgi:1,4-alpha-glucan branching enzyme